MTSNAAEDRFAAAEARMRDRHRREWAAVRRFQARSAVLLAAAALAPLGALAGGVWLVLTGTHETVGVVLALAGASGVWLPPAVAQWTIRRLRE